MSKSIEKLGLIGDEMHLIIQHKFIFIIAILIVSLGCGKTDATPSAPSFAIEDTDGKTITLEQYKGKMVVLDFWSVYCRTCHFSILELIELQKKYQDKGLTIIGVTVDHPLRVTNNDLIEFKKMAKMNYKIARANSQIVQDYFAGNPQILLPTIFIIDRNGKIIKRFYDDYSGYAPGEIEKVLQKYF